MKPDVVILGAAESGIGAAKLAHQRGLGAFVSEFGTIKPAFRAELDALGIPYEQGGHSLEILRNAPLCVKSPGIAPETPVVQRLRDAGTEIVSEIEFAYRFLPLDSRVIAITGSNGKTTTTTLIGQLLNANPDQPRNARVCGNIGESFARVLADEAPYPWYVVEASSFQLEDIRLFHPHIAVLTNLVPNHLNRYPSYEAYAQAKLNLLRNLRAEDHLIYCHDSPDLLQYLLPRLAQTQCPAQRHSYGRTPTAEAAAWLGPDLGTQPIELGMGDALHPIGWEPSPHAPYWLHFASTSLSSIIPFIHPPFSPQHTLMSKRIATAPASMALHTLKVENNRLNGAHNQQNVMAASLTAQLALIRKDYIRECLGDFAGVPHRIEFIGDFDGVSYVNDSKATNVNSAFFALESMAQPVVWIVGGVDKGNDYGVLQDIVRSKVKAIVMIGEHTQKIQEAFQDTVAILRRAKTMKAAVEMANSVAREGDVVLLSPACASFDMFESFEERGNVFRTEVIAQAKSRANSAATA
jgi:UDP-N-acetylmuramoylalanine--D-glutamate ligase